MSDELLCDVKLPMPTKSTFESASIETKLSFLFDMSCVALENQKLVLAALRRDKKYNTVLSSLFGLLGGAAAYTAERLTNLLR